MPMSGLTPPSPLLSSPVHTHIPWKAHTGKELAGSNSAHGLTLLSEPEGFPPPGHQDMGLPQRTRTPSLRLKAKTKALESKA